MAGIAKFSVEIPMHLHDRACAVKRRLRMPLVQIIREALDARVEQYETKFRIEDERARMERDTKRGGRRLRALGEDPRPLAPAAPTPLEERLAARELRDDADGEESAPVAPTEDALDALYAEHGARIAEVVDQPLPTEKRVRIAEALTAIKRYSPLTHPADTVILARLERVVVEVRERAPKSVGVIDAADTTPPPSASARFFDDLVGATINTTKVRTFGDVDGADKK